MEKLILTLLLDIKSFFYERFPGTVQFETGFRGLSDNELIEFEIRIKGLAMSDGQKKTIDAINYNDPAPADTDEFEALQKVKDAVSKLNGKLHFTILYEGEIIVHVLIPQQAASLKTGR